MSKIAQVAELVDALDSKSSDFGRVGSIPTLSTNKLKSKRNHIACFFISDNKSINFYKLFIQSD